MQDIDSFLQILNNAENKIEYELHPMDGIAVTTQPPGRMSMPNVKTAVWIFQKDTEGKNIHRARFDVNAQGQLESVKIE